MKPSTWALLAGVALVGVWLMSKTTRTDAATPSTSTGPTQGSNPLYSRRLLSASQITMADLIAKEAQAAGVNPAFMIALALTESSLNGDAIGDDGMSYGLFQLNKKFHQLSDTQLLDPVINADTAMVEMLALIRRYPGHSFGDYAEAWALGGSGRFTKLRRYPVKIANMRKAITDLALDLDLEAVL